MMRAPSTILSLLKEGRTYLETQGVPNAWHNVQWMLSHLLGCSVADLFLDSGREVSKAVVDRFKEFIGRRGAREPLQYILGTTEFMSLSFLISPGVFIPRFETELLVEKVETEIKTHYSNGPVKVLDLCSGSGVIAVSLAGRLPDISAVGVEISEEAVAVAEKNAALNGVSDRVEFILQDARDFLSAAGGKFDVISCNPPYIKVAELMVLPPEVREYEPLLGINGGPDGLDFYRALIPLLRERMSPGGLAAFEIGADQGDAVSNLMNEASFTGIQVFKDYSHMDRVVMGKLGNISSR